MKTSLNTAKLGNDRVTLDDLVMLAAKHGFDGVDLGLGGVIGKFGENGAAAAKGVVRGKWSSARNVWSGVRMAQGRGHIPKRLGNSEDAHGLRAGAWRDPLYNMDATVGEWRRCRVAHADG